MTASSDDGSRPSALELLRLEVDTGSERVTLPREILRPLALAAEIGTSLTRERTLAGALQRCAESIVRHLDAAFARVWTLDHAADVLELRASAGLYTHLDGPHARVPVGAFKIGLIAQERAPHLTNDVLTDPRVGNKPWAAAEGMVAFAGYPLLVGERVMGVLAMFARVPLQRDTLDALASVADVIALAIEREHMSVERDAVLARERSARARAEASEAQFRTFADSVSHLAWTADPTGHIGWYNQRWYDYTGTTPETMAAAGWSSVHAPDFLPEVLARWAHSVATGDTLDMEFPLRGADGVYRWFLTRATPVRDADGHVVRWIGTDTDIDRSRRASQQQRFLAEAGAQLAASLDVERTVAEVVALAVPGISDWCAVDVAERTADGTVTGFRRLAVAHVDPAKVRIAHDLQQRVPPRVDDPTGVPAVVRTGRTEFVHEMPEGLIESTVTDPGLLEMVRSLALRSWIIVPLVARGQVLGALTLVLSGATRRFTDDDVPFAEELGRRAGIAIDNAGLMRRVTHGEERYRALVEGTSQIVWIAGPDGIVTEASPSYRAFTGVEIHSGPDATSHAAMHPEDRARVDALWDASIRERRRFDTQYRLRHRDGSWRHVEAHATPVSNADGSLREWIGVNVDVTERVRAQRDRERLIDALATSNRELDQFAYVTSHDLKAPLRGIANLAQWIGEDLGDRISDEGREHLRLLGGRVHRMEALIDGILAYSRAGRVREAAEELDTGRLIRDVVELVSPSAGAVVDVLDPMPTIETERVPLEQVFINLVGNALKHARRDDPRVEVRAREEDSHVVFTVKDNGPGIAPEYHERIWAIFQTLEARDKVEGTGIGLSVVKKIVETRGGRVAVHSAEGAGATFEFTWPRVPVAAPDGVV